MRGAKKHQCAKSALVEYDESIRTVRVGWSARAAQATSEDDEIIAIAATEQNPQKSSTCREIQAGVATFDPGT